MIVGIGGAGVLPWSDRRVTPVQQDFGTFVVGGGWSVKDTYIAPSDKGFYLSQVFMSVSEPTSGTGAIQEHMVLVTQPSIGAGVRILREGWVHSTTIPKLDTPQMVQGIFLEAGSKIEYITLFSSTTSSFVKYSFIGWTFDL